MFVDYNVGNNSLWQPWHQSIPYFDSKSKQTAINTRHQSDKLVQSAIHKTKLFFNFENVSTEILISHNHYIELLSTSNNPEVSLFQQAQPKLYISILNLVMHARITVYSPNPGITLLSHTSSFRQSFKIMTFMNGKLYKFSLAAQPWQATVAANMFCTRNLNMKLKATMLTLVNRFALVATPDRTSSACHCNWPINQWIHH